MNKKENQMDLLTARVFLGKLQAQTQAGSS
jgi:hypothetical protein